MSDFKFEVGDEVLTPYGRGKITIIRDSASMPYFVEYNDNSPIWYQEHELELINKEKDNMEDFAIKIENEEHGKLVIGILESQGLDTPYSDCYHDNNEYKYKYIHARFNHKDYDYIGYDITKDENILEDFTFQELIDALNGEYQWEEEPIEIGGYEVEFAERKIIIGCQEYPNFVVHQMYDLMSNRNIKSFVISDENITVTRCQMEEIVDKINE